MSVVNFLFFYWKWAQKKAQANLVKSKTLSTKINAPYTVLAAVKINGILHPPVPPSKACLFFYFSLFSTSLTPLI